MLGDWERFAGRLKRGERKRKRPNRVQVPNPSPPPGAGFDDLKIELHDSGIDRQRWHDQGACSHTVRRLSARDWTNGFSKKFENHVWMVALYAVWKLV
jgi:hypothetical protein